MSEYTLFDESEGTFTTYTANANGIRNHVEICEEIGRLRDEIADTRATLGEVDGWDWRMLVYLASRHGLARAYN